MCVCVCVCMCVYCNSHKHVDRRHCYCYFWRRLCNIQSPSRSMLTPDATVGSEDSIRPQLHKETSFLTVHICTSSYCSYLQLLPSFFVDYCMAIKNKKLELYSLIPRIDDTRIGCEVCLCTANFNYSDAGKGTYGSGWKLYIQL